MADPFEIAGVNILEIIRKPSVKKDNIYDQEGVQRAISEIQSIGKDAYQAISKMLEYNEVRQFLVEAGESSLPFLEFAIGDEDAKTREIAINVLPQVGEAAFPLIEKTFLTDDNRQIRTQCATSLAYMGEKGLVVLRETIVSGDENLHISAIEGIRGKLFTEQRQNEPVSAENEPLVELLRLGLNDKTGEVRSASLNALTIIGRTFLEDVDDAIDDGDSKVRHEALLALSKMGIDEESTPIYVRSLEDADGAISGNAVQLIAGPYAGHVDPNALVDAIIDHLIIRVSNRPSEIFNTGILVSALNKAFGLNPRLFGLTLHRLRDLAIEHKGGVRRRSVLVAGRLDEAEFVSLVNERTNENPKAVRDILNILGIHRDTDAIVQEISETDPGDIQKIAATQIKLLNNIYEDVLSQSNTSFRWAIAATVVSLLLLITTIAFVLANSSQNLVALLASIGTFISQILAGSQFYLYGLARKQLADYHQKLDRTQRFLLANSVCEALDNEHRQRTRADLVRWIATLEFMQNPAER